MAADDAQRTWFPEMIKILRARWNVGLAFVALIELRDELDAMLHRIRAERHIRPPVIKWPAVWTCWRSRGARRHRPGDDLIGR
jgi:hypothetical protein